MSKARVTISDLARTLKLSTCTVSKILNKSFDGFSYAPETIRRVESAAARLGYQVNAQARALRTKRSGLIGFILPSGRHAVFGELTDQLEFQLRRSGRQLLIGHSRDSSEDERELLKSFVSRGLDGLFWIPSRERIKLGEYQIAGNFPIVMLDRPNSGAKVPHVVTDNRASCRLLAERIFAAGHRRIAVLNASEGDRSMKERFLGINDVFARGAITWETKNTAEASRSLVGEILRATPRCTAWVALSEPLALGALTAIKDLGISIPEQLSFAAFDDFPLAAHWSPRITAMRQNLSTIADLAAEKMLFMLEKGDSPLPADARVPAILEWRDSVLSLR